jgi:hypothetical protein
MQVHSAAILSAAWRGAIVVAASAAALHEKLLAHPALQFLNDGEGFGCLRECTTPQEVAELYNNVCFEENAILFLDVVEM